MTLGELYGALKPLCYPRGLPDRVMQSRDISVLKRFLKGYTPEEIVMMCATLRAQADDGECDWIPKGANFSCRVIVKYAPLLLAESRKLRVKRAEPTGPISLASLLGEFGA